MPTLMSPWLADMHGLQLQCLLLLVPASRRVSRLPSHTAQPPCTCTHRTTGFTLSSPAHVSSSGGFRASTDCVPSELPALCLISPLAPPRAALHVATGGRPEQLPQPLLPTSWAHLGPCWKRPPAPTRHLGVGVSTREAWSQCWCVHDQCLRFPRARSHEDGSSFRAQAHCACTLGSRGPPLP